QAAALDGRADLDRERGERGRPAALLAQAKGVLDEPVYPGGQALDGAVPGEGNRVALGEDDVLVLVVEDELELTEVVVEPAPVPVQDVAVRVVLRPDVEVDAVREVGALGIREDG